MNAILNKNSASVSGGRMYVALFPCNECAKLIIQSGLKEVIYLSDKYHDQPAFVASRRMLDMAGVVQRQHAPKNTRVVIEFGTAEADAATALAVAAHEKAEAEATARRGHATAAAEGTATTPGEGWANPTTLS